MKKARTNLSGLRGLALALPALILWLGIPSAASDEAPPASRTEIAGMVADELGQPLRGATVSVFGGGLANGALTAVTDEHGRFSVRSLPPGMYRLRAYLSGFFPSRYAKVLIEDGSERVGAILMSLASLEAVDDLVADGDEPRTLDELRWLLQHGDRNVLKEEEQVVSIAELASWDETPASAALRRHALELSGEFGVRVASYDEGLSEFPGAGAGLDGRLAYARLFLPTTSDARWLVSAQLLESALSAWAGRAEYSSELSGHRVQAGVTYGNYLYGDVDGFRPPESALTTTFASHRSREWFGSVYAADTFALGASTVSTGLAYEYYDYLGRAGYASPRIAVDVPLGGSQAATVLRGAADYRVQAPGGEDFGLLSQMAFSDVYGPTKARSPLRAQTTARLQLGLDHRLSDRSYVAVRLFEERSADQLVKAYLRDRPESARGAGHFAVANQGDFRTRGVGLSVTQSFGALSGTVGYTYGLAEALVAAQPAAPVDEEIHDLTTTVATSIERTQTRLRAAYRLIAHPTLVPSRVGFSPGSTVDSRFSLQVYQILPFVGWNGTSWELMLAVRNLFYEDLESASMLDELAVIDAPRRVLGGVTVRF